MVEDSSSPTWADVQERLVEAVRLCWQEEPGRWPFASDGPWHLLSARGRAESDMDAWRLEQEAVDAAARRRLPLTRDEVARRDQVLGWLADHVAEQDRRIVVLGVRQLAAGAKRISWRKVRAQLRCGPGGLDVPGSDRGLGMRYSRAVTGVVRALDGVRVAA